ncbi:MAG: CapA family protein [Bacteroidia bacterium]|nr:CapA family protein [Bacteroidia bacterium]MDW8334411.1 CapA family protein [Bacteroidia bacterium]
MKILFVGDLAVCGKGANPPYDDRTLEHFSDYDFRVVNFEAPISTEARPPAKVGPIISQNRGWGSAVAPFNVASLANNHVMDYGAEGLKATLEALERRGISTFGAGMNRDEAYRPLILEKDGQKVALLGAGEAQFGCLIEDDAPGYAWIFHPLTIENIRRCKASGCTVVVLPHAGLEMESLPLPEWRNAYRQLIDAGADAIVASHPHVLQAREWHRGKPIYYSLGNFYFPLDKPRSDPRWYVSMGVVMEPAPNPVFEHVFFRFDRDGVRFHDLSQEFDELCRELQSPDYPQKINRACLEAWDKFYQKMYMFHPVAKRYNPFRSLDRLFNAAVYLLKGNAWFDRVNEMRLYHNIRVETNRFVVERALALRNGLYR